MSEVYVSPEGARMRVASPAAVIRMRARGWLPESEQAAQSAKPAPKPAKQSESAQS